jgi:hypothetical protein
VTRDFSGREVVKVLQTFGYRIQAVIRKIYDDSTA